METIDALQLPSPDDNPNDNITVSGSWFATDVLQGYGGQDTLKGSDADEILYGNYNPDRESNVLLNRDPADAVIAEDGNDFLYGRGGNDQLFGDAGDDILNGGPGNDTINGGSRADVVIVDDGVDTVDYSDSPSGVNVDLAAGTAQDGFSYVDTLISIENVTGSEFADYINGNASSNEMRGEGGDDYFYAANAGDDSYDGGAGKNTVSYFGAPKAISVNLSSGVAHDGFGNQDTLLSISDVVGSIYDDLLVGDGNGNYLFGSFGKDTLIGLDGNDRLLGYDGDDLLFGDVGDDFLQGGWGRDHLGGGSGTDTVSYGPVGSVRVDLESPATNTGEALGDTYSSIENLEGGWYDDILLGNNLGNTIRGSSDPSLPSGNDELYGRDGSDTLEGYDGNDRLVGGLGADVMLGGAGNDTFYVDNTADQARESGNQGVDRVISSVTYSLAGQAVENLTLTGSGNLSATGNGLVNTLIGNSGNNVLDGKAGNDVMTGGAGSDVFAFTSSLAASNIETITDFNVAADSIRLSRTIFNTIVGMGTLSTTQFVANAGGTAQDANDRIIYETDTGKLFYDSNGNAAGGGVQIAKLSSGLALAADDFSIV